MIGWLGGAYIWVLAAHVIFVIFWMAGLFSLGRYLVYHREAAPGSEAAGAWDQRTRTLRKVIVNPAMIAVWLLGLALAFNIGFAGQGWLHAKIAIVLLLSGWHGWAVGASKKLTRGERPYSDRALRLLNEAPALAIVLIVVLVIVKPF